LYNIMPAVVNGGQIQTSETINQNTTLEDNLTITAGDTLYINAVYTVRDTIFVNDGGFVKINHGGAIVFEDGGALVYQNWSDCLVINQNATHPKLMWQNYGTGNRYKIYRQKDNPYYQLIATIHSDTITTYEDIYTIIAFGLPQMIETIANYYIIVEAYKRIWMAKDTTNIAGVTRTVANIEKAAATSETIITEYNLLQNYPNPFNPVTTIHYQLAADSRVLLTVYDILGDEVAVLVDEVKPMGKYEITFDASTLSSGMYLYKLTAGNYTKIQKMLLLK
ncbi:MAG: T9SS type A sorting domain-containing protein, partial [Ignavibacteriaceae bacterium]|nr:T9SS type A sorting domain-containing protein [Ignavibacteriaceae bacterium]